MVYTDFNNSGFVFDGRLVPVLQVSYTKSGQNKGFKITAKKIETGLQITNNIGKRKFLSYETGGRYFKETPKGGVELDLDTFIDDLPVIKGSNYRDGVSKVGDLRDKASASYAEIKRLIKSKYNADRQKRKNEIIASRDSKLYEMDIGARQYDTSAHYQDYQDSIRTKALELRADKARKSLRGAKAKLEKQKEEVAEQQTEIKEQQTEIKTQSEQMEEQKTEMKTQSEQMEEQQTEMKNIQLQIDELKEQKKQSVQEVKEALEKVKEAKREGDIQEERAAEQEVIANQAKVSAENEEIKAKELTQKISQLTETEQEAERKKLEAERLTAQALTETLKADAEREQAEAALIRAKKEALDERVKMLSDVMDMAEKLNDDDKINQQQYREIVEGTKAIYDENNKLKEDVDAEDVEKLTDTINKQIQTAQQIQTETQTQTEEETKAEETAEESKLDPPPPASVPTPPTSAASETRSPLIERKKAPAATAEFQKQRRAKNRQERAKTLTGDDAELEQALNPDTELISRQASDTTTSTFGSGGGFETAEGDDTDDEYVGVESKAADQTIQQAPAQLNTGAGSQAPQPPVQPPPPPPPQPPQGDVGPIPQQQQQQQQQQPPVPPPPPPQPPQVQQLPPQAPPVPPDTTGTMTEGMTLDDRLAEGGTDATEKEKADPTIATDGLDDVSNYGYDKQVYLFAISQGRDFTYSQDLVKRSKDAPKQEPTERRKQILTALRIYGYTIDIQKPKTNDFEEALEIMTFIYLALDKFRLERQWKRAITMLPDMLENIGLNADEVGDDAPPANQQLGLITQFANPQILANLAAQQPQAPQAPPPQQQAPPPQQQQPQQNIVGRNQRIPNAPQGIQRVRIPKAQKPQPQKKAKAIDTRPRMNVKEIQFKMKKSRINPNLLFTNLTKQNPKPQGQDSIFKTRPNNKKRRVLYFSSCD